MPFDITVDGDTVEKDGTVTLRERDTTGQVCHAEYEARSRGCSSASVILCRLKRGMPLPGVPIFAQQLGMWG